MADFQSPKNFSAVACVRTALVGSFRAVFAFPASQPILEINPEHPIVQRLKQESDQVLFEDWSQVLFEQAMLAEGTELEDPAGFVKRLNKLTMTLAGAGPSRIWTPGT